MGEVAAIGSHVFMGGMTRGIMEALDVQAQYEIFNLGELTVEHNTGMPFFQADDANWWHDILKSNPAHDEAAVLYGNPRCTGFSALGHGCSEDAHGAWSRPTLDIRQLCWLKSIMKGPDGKGPLVWGFESVQEAATTGRDLIEAMHQMHGAGYRRAELFHNAAQFGNAQHRRRVIFLWYRADMSLPVEEITEEWLWRGPHVTVGQALRGEAPHHGKVNLWDVPAVSHRSIDGFDTIEKVKIASPWIAHPYLAYTELPDGCITVPVLNHYHKDITDPYLECSVKLVKEGHSMNRLPAELLEEHGYDEFAEKKEEGISFSWHAPRRLHRDGACPVVYSASGKFMHPEHNRPLTVAELSRLMGFDDEWAVLGPDPIAQLGKGLCVHVGRWLGHLIKAGVTGSVKRREDPGHEFEQFRLDRDYGWVPKKPKVEKDDYDEYDD